MFKNRLYYGDNLQVLRDHIADESVDLIYLDPPFNSRAAYNLLFPGPSGKKSGAQIEAFEDTWEWGEEAESAFRDVLHGPNTDAAAMLSAMQSFLKGRDALMAYLAMMTVRLVELHRVLKPTGSLYLHCDPTASHYLKILLDSIFEPQNFINEIIWKRTTAHSDSKQGSTHFGRVHDCLLFYAKAPDHPLNMKWLPYDEEYIETHYRFVEKGAGRRYRKGDLTANRPGGDTSYEWKGVRPYKGRYWAYSKEKMEQFEREGRLVYTKSGMPEFKRYLDEMPGRPLQDVWDDIAPINSQAQERIGYPTQKPVALLERIVEASSNPGDIVLDPFCGCGTTIHAAQKLGRCWIGIDITHLAISLIEKRLRDAFGEIEFEVYGTPKDLDGAMALATANKYQFQWWAVSLVGAQPYGGKKKGADSGIDGILYFMPDAKTSEKAIVSVKGGANLDVAMIRDLGHVVDREKALIGLFLTLSPPTKPMRTEAIKAGFVETSFGPVPKLQILTIEELLAGKKAEIPAIDPRTFKKAPGETMERQSSLPLAAEKRPGGDSTLEVQSPPYGGVKAKPRK